MDRMEWLDIYLVFSQGWLNTRFEPLRGEVGAVNHVGGTAGDAGLGACGERGSVGTGCCHMQPIYSNYLSRSLQVQWAAALSFGEARRLNRSLKRA